MHEYTPNVSLDYNIMENKQTGETKVNAVMKYALQFLKNPPGMKETSGFLFYVQDSQEFFLNLS